MSSLTPLFAFVDDFVFRHSLDDGTAFMVNLAVEEVFTNMIKYGGGEDTVSVVLERHGDDLVIELVHPGAAAFDISAAGAVNVDRPLEERAPGGLGLHLVRSVMDRVGYAHRGGCAHVTLTKRLGGG